MTDIMELMKRELKEARAEIRRLKVANRDFQRQAKIDLHAAKTESKTALKEIKLALRRTEAALRAARADNARLAGEVAYFREMHAMDREYAWDDEADDEEGEVSVGDGYDVDDNLFVTEGTSHARIGTSFQTEEPVNPKVSDSRYWHRTPPILPCLLFSGRHKASEYNTWEEKEKEKEGGSDSDEKETQASSGEEEGASGGEAIDHGAEAWKSGITVEVNAVEPDVMHQVDDVEPKSTLVAIGGGMSLVVHTADDDPTNAVDVGGYECLNVYNDYTSYAGGEVDGAIRSHNFTRSNSGTVKRVRFS